MGSATAISNEQIGAMFGAGPPFVINSPFHDDNYYTFDSCSIPYFISLPEDSEEALKLQLEIAEKYPTVQDKIDANRNGTMWTGIWAWIGIFQILIFINGIFLMAGSFFWYLRCCASCCNCCLAFFNCIIVFAGLAGALAPASRLCGLNQAPVKYNGDGKWDMEGPTYADEHSSMIAIDAVAILLAFFQCCMCLPCLATPSYKKSGDKSSSSDSDKEKKEKKEKKKEEQSATPNQVQ